MGRGDRGAGAHREGWLEAMQEEHDACARRERERAAEEEEGGRTQSSERVREKERQTPICTRYGDISDADNS